MTPRPHPAQRPTQSVTSPHENVQQSKPQAAKRARLKAIDFLSEDAEPPHAIKPSRLQDMHDGRGESDNQDTDVDSDADGDVDPDAPRVAQWVDDEQVELHTPSDDRGDSPSLDSDSGSDEDNEHSASEVWQSRRLRSLEDDLSTLPLGTLRSAQRSLAQARALSDSESNSGEPSSKDDSDDATFPRPIKSNDKRNPSKLSRSKNDLAKRANKHAPMEVTSKRPVSRTRVVVDDKFPKPRDPRFIHSAGLYDADKFKQRYDFLSDMRKDELSTLRDHTKRARKLITNSPAHLRAEREEELRQLERAMKRSESAVNMDNRERVERGALQAAKESEKEKREKGKAGWWMKRSEKKELLAKARLDAVAAVGGKLAVKKAMEKKQKKISQKEKRARPFPQSEGIESSNSRRRRPVGSVDSRGAKRRKVA